MSLLRDLAAMARRAESLRALGHVSAAVAANQSAQSTDRPGPHPSGRTSRPTRAA